MGGGRGPDTPGSLPVWLLRWIFRRQALSYCLLHPGKEQEKSSCSRKWARLWENRALTVINVFSQPEQRDTEPAHWWGRRHITELTQSPPGRRWHWAGGKEDDSGGGGLTWGQLGAVHRPPTPRSHPIILRYSHRLPVQHDRPSRCAGNSMTSKPNKMNQILGNQIMSDQAKPERAASYYSNT